MNNDQILAILIAAKQRYLSMTFQGCAVGFPGMCFCIKQEAKEICPLISYSYIPSLIPEFNSKFLDGSQNPGYWWPIADINSRIKAFDKLIILYQKKVNKNPNKLLCLISKYYKKLWQNLSLRI